MVLLLALGYLIVAVGAQSNELPYSAPVPNAKAAYHVAVIFEDQLTCSGSIVSPNYALTAGICIPSVDMKFQIRAGSNAWNQGSLHNVSKIIVHEHFGYGNIGAPVNDLALLRVEPPFKPDQTRRVVGLFNANRKATAGQLGLVTSWAGFDSGQVSNTLQSLTVAIINRQACINAFPKGRDLSDEQICTAVPKGVVNDCYGDAGAPLVIGGVQAGIVSWSGPGCDMYKYPSVYTEIAHHRSWIDSHIRN